LELAVAWLGPHAALEPNGEIPRQGVEALSSQQRYEVFIGKERLQGLYRKHQAITSRLGLSHEQTLLLDVGSIRPDERMGRQALRPLGAAGSEAFAASAPLLD
jgi:hypothetical protein